MNFYLIEKADERNFPEILSTLKQFLKERLSGAIEDPVLKLAYDEGNSFFLKTHASIIWVRMFEESLKQEDLPGLSLDLERVCRMFHQKVRIYLFAPGYETGLKLAGEVSPEVLFFEYSFLKSRFGHGIALREAKIECSAPVLPDSHSGDRTSPPEASPIGHFKNTRLEREELSELINLSLELKGLSFKG